MELYNNNTIAGICKDISRLFGSRNSKYKPLSKRVGLDTFKVVMVILVACIMPAQAMHGSGPTWGMTLCTQCAMPADTGTDARIAPYYPRTSNAAIMECYLFASDCTSAYSIHASIPY